MTYARKLILRAPPWRAGSLAAFVEACLADGVGLICVLGPDCERVEDVIDDLVVGDGSDPERFILTASHLGQTVDDVRAFAARVTVDGADDGPIDEVRLAPD